MEPGGEDPHILNIGIPWKRETKLMLKLFSVQNDLMDDWVEA
jgi:hypothetical protein